MISPSNKVTGLLPCSRSFTKSPLAKVDLPEPDKPVKKTVNPLFDTGGRDFWSSFATSV